jgi:hypothetical protein
MGRSPSFQAETIDTNAIDMQPSNFWSFIVTNQELVLAKKDSGPVLYLHA